MSTIGPRRVISQLIRDMLKADAKVSALVGERIYPNQAKAGVDRPYIIYGTNAGRNDNSTAITHVKTRMLVKGVSEIYAKALEVADAIHEVLDHDEAEENANAVITPGWRVIFLEEEEPEDYIENVSQTQLYHAGGVYRLEINQV